MRYAVLAVLALLLFAMAAALDTVSDLETELENVHGRLDKLDNWRAGDKAKIEELESVVDDIGQLKRDVEALRRELHGR